MKVHLIVLDGEERVLDLLGNSIIVRLQLSGRALRVLELGGFDLFNAERKGGLDVCPRDFFVGRALGDRALAVLVHGDDDLQHTDL